MQNVSIGQVAWGVYVCISFLLLWVWFSYPISMCWLLEGNWSGAWLYSVILKDGFNFLSLYFKIRTSDKYDMAWTVNSASTHTRQLVAGIPISLLALRVDLRGLRSKFSWIRLTFSSDTRGRPELLPLHRQPICSNWWFQRLMLFLVGRWMLKRRRNARCTAVADSVLMNSRTQKNLVLHSSHFALNWRCCEAVR